MSKPTCFKKLTGCQMIAENCCEDCKEFETCNNEMLSQVNRPNTMHNGVATMLLEEQPSSPYITYDRMLDILRPDLIQVQMDDVFRTLPKINRFNGHTKFTYSVARHSISCVNVAVQVYGVTDSTLLLAVLIHDAPEAYVGDIVRPLKQLLGEGIGKIEKQLTQKFLDIFDFTKAEKYALKKFMPTLHEIDTRMGATEAKILTKHTILPDLKTFDDIYVQQYSWQTDEQVFRNLYLSLCTTREGQK